MTLMYCLSVGISATNKSFSVDVDASGESRVGPVVFLMYSLASNTINNITFFLERSVLTMALNVSQGTEGLRGLRTSDSQVTRHAL